jgi:hypothetical protein
LVEAVNGSGGGDVLCLGGGGVMKQWWWWCFLRLGAAGLGRLLF